MPPLPLKSIKVAGHRVRIKVDPNLGDNWGQFDLDQKLISISRRTLDERKDLDATLKHELVHAALRLSGVSFTMNADTEEAVVRCMEQIFLPALSELESSLKRKPKRRRA